MIRLDFPLPETPDMQQNSPKGSLKSISFKLLVNKPEKESILLLFLILLFLGVKIAFFPERYKDVKLSLFLSISLRFP